MKHQLLCSLGAFLGVFVAWGTYLSVQQNAYIHSLRDVDESFVMGAQLSHLLIAAAFMTVLILYRYLAIRYLYLSLGDYLLPSLAWKNRKTFKWSAKERQMRVERFAVCFFKLTYFLGSTSAGFYLFWNREWFPSILGGQAESFRPLYEAYPFVPITDGVILYYMCQLAYHTHSLVYQFAKSKRNDFLEMIIHHVCAIFLVLFSYFNGFHRVGCAVYFLHDLADVWAYAVKSTVDTDYIALVLSCYFSLLGSWGYLRLYALPLMTLNLPVFWDCLATSTVYQYAPNLGNIFSIQVAMLYILIALHYMWYGLFLQIGYTFFCKGIKEDTQAKIVVTEEEERVCKGEEEQKDGDKEPSKQKTAGLGELRQRLQQNVN